MAGRIATAIKLFSGCYFITGSIRQSIRFVFLPGGKRGTAIKLPGKRDVLLRKNETDQEVFLSVFMHHYHRCPFDLGKSPFIIDLGSHTGLTIIDFKSQYPAARIIGVEMDNSNYELCKANIAGLTDCSVLNAAIWNKKGFINYAGKDDQSFTIDEDSFGTHGTVRCMTIDDLFEENNAGNIDYMKMDIEGAEKAVLLNSAEKKWMKQVKYLSIEVHDLRDMDKTILIERLKTELENNQFMTYTSGVHWSSLFAVNKLLTPA